MFLDEAVTEVGHGRGLSLGLNVAQRVAARLDQPLEFPRLDTGRANRPVREGPDGNPTLASGLGPIGQDEGTVAVGGDADAETGDAAVAVVIDPVALGGHWQFARCVGGPSDFLPQMVAHPSLVRRYVVAAAHDTVAGSSDFWTIRLNQ